MENFRSYYEAGLAKEAYITHTAGDVSGFRYPHLGSFERYFRYDPRWKYWQFDPALTGSEPGGETDLLRRYGAEDITLWEFLVPEAKKLHTLDMGGVSALDEEKQAAFEAVKTAYAQREIRFPGMRAQTFALRDLPVRKSFQPVAALYEDLADIPVRMITVEAGELSGASPFPFGSMIKGTDLCFTDGNAMNFGQDFLHSLYHLKEGIPGVNDDNLYVEEQWADVPALYAMQLAAGRMARRKRLRPSPHPIHFTDYIYLRALLGQAFAGEADISGTEPAGSGAAAAGLLHPIYGVIAPSIRLMICGLIESGAVQEEQDIVRILADAVLEDQTDELVRSFERVFGEGSFAGVYDTYSIYDKFDRALQFAPKTKLNRVLFGDQEDFPVLPPHMGRADTERIWRDPEYRAAWMRELR